MTTKPDLARRGLLLRLGLIAGAVYAAPTLMHLNAARASTGGSGASGGASGASGASGVSAPSGRQNGGRQRGGRGSAPSGRAWSGRGRRASRNSRPSR